jgi:hypothetical protein
MVSIRHHPVNVSAFTATLASFKRQVAIRAGEMIEDIFRPDLRFGAARQSAIMISREDWE